MSQANGKHRLTPMERSKSNRKGGLFRWRGISSQGRVAYAKRINRIRNRVLSRAQRRQIACLAVAAREFYRQGGTQEEWAAMNTGERQHWYQEFVVDVRK